MSKKKISVVLNIGVQSVGIARFSNTSDDGLVLEDYKINTLLGDPSTDASRISQTKMALTELYRAINLKNDDINYAISSQSVFTRFIKLPPLDNEKVSQIVQFEARQNVPFPINEVIWDYQLLSSDDSDEVEVALAAIKADVLNEIDKNVQDVGFITNKVDVSPFALLNSFVYNYGNLQDCSLIIDIGARLTNLIFIEGRKIYTRSSTQAGGVSITLAIAKEFNVSFSEAEQMKINNGFINLGGSYSDHDDPKIAAMSKVIRNVMTRIHGDVIRTMTFYRSQQSGGKIERAFLSGSNVQLGFIKEFFEEKLKIPVDIFNPLKNITISENINLENLSEDVHRMGELVGMSLRSFHQCPMNIDMVPDLVQARRELNYRKPYFITSAILFFLALFSLAFFFFNAEKKIKIKNAKLSSDIRELEKYQTVIDKINGEIGEIDNRTKKYAKKIAYSKFWISMLDDLNSRIPAKIEGEERVFVWYTDFVPVNNSKPIISPLINANTSGADIFSTTDGKNVASYEKNEKVTHLLVKGLYLENESGSNIIYNDLYKNLQNSPFFNLESIDKKDIVKANSGGSRDKWAYDFSLNLPLSTPILLN